MASFSLPLPLDALLVGLLVQVHGGLLLGVPEVGLLDEAGHVELGGVGDLLSYQSLLVHELALQVLDAGDQVLDDLTLVVVDRAFQAPVVEPWDDRLSIWPSPDRDLLLLGGPLLGLLPSI